MNLKIELDPSLVAELESLKENCDILYVEQQDSPPYNFLVLGVSRQSLVLCERMDFKETSQHFLISSEIYDTVISLSIPNISIKEPCDNIFGGTLACFCIKNQGPLCCFKIESVLAQGEVGYSSWLSSFSKILKDLNVELNGNWYILPHRTASCKIKSNNPLIVDMEIPMRVRLVANRMGLKYASDFSGIHMSELKIQLSPDSEKQIELCEELIHELHKLGISMIE